LWIADDRRLAAPVCVQVKYNLIDRAAEAELAPACVQFGLSIVPFGPLHGGLLAGTTQIEEREFAGDKRFGGSGFSETEFEVGREVERLAQDWSVQSYQVSLAWLLSRPAVASVIVGAETVEEITANATAANVKLEQAQLDALTALRAGDDDS
jgi:aryl-alcohol dehydrogenase-like predicted oxidoreductase